MAAQLADKQYDILVVGAGIYGATLAYRAAQAGFSVALIDKGDYGEGASANSLKILHGGLRYLQTANFSRMRESIRSRRDGFCSLPNLTRPALFIALTGDSLTRSSLAYQTAAWMNDLVSVDRNHGVPPTHRIPRTRVLSSHEVNKLVPSLDTGGRRALAWHDGIILNTERYTLSYVFSAKDSGADVSNYIQARSLIIVSGKACGVEAVDLRTGNNILINARITVNTTSAWRNEWPDAAPPSDPPNRWIRALNVVTHRNWFGDSGVGLDNGRQNLFFAPWRGGTMIGTLYFPFLDAADRCGASDADLEEIVRQVNLVYPQAAFTRGDISFVHTGILPAAKKASGEANAESEDRTFIWRHGEQGTLPGYYVLQGVKYTTANYWAGKAVSMMREELKPSRRAGNGKTSLYGSGSMVASSTDNAAWLSTTYGAEAGRVMQFAGEGPEWSGVIPGTCVPAASVLHAVRKEDAYHLSDFILRRTDIGTASMPEDLTLSACADLMSKACHWSEERKKAELDALRLVYRKNSITRAAAARTSAS